MKLQNFMNVYKMKKTNEERIDEIKKHIIDNYVPYEAKADIAKAIIDASYYKIENGKKILFINSVAKYMLSCMAVFDLYTDFERQKRDGKIVEDFNIINGSGILDIILKLVNERELKEFRMIIDMVADDAISNEYENHAFIKNQMERFSELLGGILLPVLKDIDVNKIKEVIAMVNKNEGG